jgi:hypothetical protein
VPPVPRAGCDASGIYPLAALTTEPVLGVLPGINVSGDIGSLTDLSSPSIGVNNRWTEWTTHNSDFPTPPIGLLRRRLFVVISGVGGANASSCCCFFSIDRQPLHRCWANLNNYENQS